MRIFEQKFLKALSILTEARAYSPGVIHHVNGLAIKADHIQDRGTFYRVGIGPGSFKSTQHLHSNGKHDQPGDVEFWSQPIWEPVRKLVIIGVQDEDGYSKPDEEGGYDAKRGVHYYRRFKHILTIKKDNVKNVDYQGLA